MKAVLIVCSLIALSYCVGVHAANADPCTGQTVTPWVNVPEPWSLDMDSKNPIGYRQGTFGEDNSPPYCLSVGGVQNKKVEVMLEAVNKDARLCVKDTSNPVSVNDPGSVATCGNGKVHACFPASTTASSLALVVYCDTGCNTGTVTFWHRVRISNVAWTDNNNDAITNVEMWCMMQDTRNDTIYPSDLIQAYPDIEETTTTGDASTVRPFLLAIPLLAGLLALLR